MAELEKIRSLRWVLIAFLAIGMIGFLIPYDAVLALFGQGANRSIGEVGSSSISAQNWQNALMEREQLFDYTNTQSLKNDVWNDLIEQNILTSEYEDLGIDVVTQEEFDEIRFGEHISPYVQSTFYGQNVTEDAKSNWRQNFAQMATSDQRAQRQKYNGYTNVIVSKRKREKYNNLVQKGLYASSLDAKYDYLATQEKANIQYVVKRYDDINDSLVTIKDSQVRAYYQKHKGDKEYEETRSRDMKYVLFRIESSSEDISAVENELKDLATSWPQAASDSVFVMQNGGTGRYNEVSFKAADTTGNELARMAYAANIGDLVGPRQDGDNYQLARVVAKGEVADSTVSVRHILLKANDVSDEAEMSELNARADSLKRVYKNGGDWDDLVQRFSDDPGSKNNGGLYEYFPRRQMVKPFEDFSFDGNIGDIGAVETSYGVHLIEIVDQRWSVDQVSLALIERSIAPSSTTRKAILKEATDFSILYNKEQLFLDGADTSGYAVVNANRIAQNAQNIQGIQNAGKVVSWLYRPDVEKGEVSTPISVKDGYVVALVTAVREGGIPSFENVEEEMRAEVLKEEKAKLFMDKMKNGSTLEEVATLAEAKVKTARNISLKTTTIAGSSVTQQEPEVVGIALGIPMGNMSLPIKGEGGVWVVAKSEEKTTAEDKEDYFEDQDRLTTRIKGAASTRLFNAMKEDANVVDNRLSF